MKNSLVLRIIKTFNKKEWRALGKWLHSPAHNLREDVKELYDYLSSCFPFLDESLLEKEFVFKKLFPKSVYDDAQIRQTFHFFLREVENFLIYQETQSNKIQAHISLARVFRKRRLDKAFQKEMKRVDKLLEQSHYRNSDILHQRFWFEQEQYYYLSGGKRSTELNLQTLSNGLDTAYVADKLRQCCLMLAHQSVYKAGYDLGMGNEVLKYLEEHQELLEEPAIATYYYIYLSNKNPEEESYFYNLKKQLFERNQYFPPSEIRAIFLLTINYCIRKQNAGVAHFTKEAFELMKQGLERHILLENNTLSRYTFSNVISLGLLLKEFEWIEHFIENFAPFLEQKYRDAYVQYNLGILYYNKGEYDKTLEYLSQWEYKDILLNVNAKRVMLKIFFERSEFEVLESLLESTRNYIQRSKGLGYQKEIHKNFIRYLNKLMKINPFNTTQIEKLMAEIKAEKKIYNMDRNWILEQLKELAPEVAP